MNGIDALIDSHRLLVTAGAGGVGKTTVAAAVALRAAARGRSTAVLTIDPARRLAQALGLAELTGTLKPVGAEHLAKAGLELAAPLSAMMLDTKTTGDAMVRRFASSPEAAASILTNRYYQYFSTSLAGAQEYMAIEQVRALAATGDYDLIVLDTPPAAHAMEFLDAPDRLLSALESPAMQMVRKSSDGSSLTARLLAGGRNLVLKGISKMTGGSFLDDLAEFLTLFSEILDALRDASGEVHQLLRADSSAFLLVTAPTPSNLDEAEHFHGGLASRGFRFGGFILNRIHAAAPPVDAEAAAAALPAKAGALLAPLLANLADHNRLAARDLRAIDRLADFAGKPPLTIPRLPEDVHDLSGLLQIGTLLAEESR